MWKYIRHYFHIAVIAALFMVGEVLADLYQPALMKRIVLCALPFMLLCLGICIYSANPLFSRLQSQLDRINDILQEDISGIRVVKACVREGYEKLRFGGANDSLMKTQMKFLMIFSAMNPSVNALMYFTVTLLLLSGSVQAGQGTATPGMIMAAITYSTQLLNGVPACPADRSSGSPPCAGRTGSP